MSRSHSRHPEADAAWLASSQQAPLVECVDMLSHMHIVWDTATIAIIVTVVGIAFIVARKPIARFDAYRQQKYYPVAMQQVFRAQSKPVYYLVLGIVVTVVGVFVGVASLRR